MFLANHKALQFETQAITELLFKHFIENFL